MNFLVKKILKLKIILFQALTPPSTLAVLASTLLLTLDTN